MYESTFFHKSLNSSNLESEVNHFDERFFEISFLNLLLLIVLVVFFEI
ncbi:hypothetical protein GW891_02170 [bacterium]|nr:hypothetical protein [bacterium]